MSPGFFATTGLRILRGRDFVADDAAGHVLVIDGTMARALWPGEEALGRCIRLGTESSPCEVVVGVVEDAHRADVVEERPSMQYYLPLARSGDDAIRRPGVLIVRAPPDRAGEVASTVSRMLRDRIPGAEPSVRALADLLAPQLRTWRVGATLFTALGLLALAVAALGIYSAMAYTLSQRTHEFGVRFALGARSADVLRLVLGQGLRVVLLGVALGCGLALAAGRLVASMLYATSPHDPIVLAAVALTLVATAAVAILVPTWRAARANPAAVLRAE